MTHPRKEELIEKLHSAELAVPLGLYDHFKGDRYQVIGNCLLESSDLVGIEYHPIGDPELKWVRPLLSFTEMVDTEQQRVKRFSRVLE